MVGYLLLLVLSLIPSTQAVAVIDFREPTIYNAFYNDTTTFNNPTLEVAAVVNSSTQERLLYQEIIQFRGLYFGSMPTS
jgi:hypothetical protein